MEGSDAELTCAAGTLAAATGIASAWVFAGDSAGRVRAFPRVETGADDAQDAAESAWTVDACAAAVTSLCALEEPGQAEPLVVAGSADGELVFLRGDLELRRFRLAASVAVRRIAHVRGGEFLVGDLHGALYSATRHEIRWKEALPDSGTHDPSSLFPGAAQPIVADVVPVKLLDVQGVESSYALVSAGQRALLLTHRGRVFATIRSPSPLTTIARCQPAGGEGAAAPAEDLVLAAGEEGVVYRLASTRGASTSTSTAERPDFQLVLEPWASVSFPIAKLLVVSGPKAGVDAAAGLTWLSVGVYGQTALFRGRELVKQWGVAGSADSSNLLVDALLLSVPGEDQQDVMTVGLVFPDGIRRVTLKA